MDLFIGGSRLSKQKKMQVKNFTIGNMGHRQFFTRNCNRKKPHNLFNFVN